MSCRLRLMPGEHRGVGAADFVASHAELRFFGDGLVTVRYLSDEAAPVALPSLRLRSEDIAALAQHLDSVGRQPVARLPLTLVAPVAPVMVETQPGHDARGARADRLDSPSADSPSLESESTGTGSALQSPGAAARPAGGIGGGAGLDPRRRQPVARDVSESPSFHAADDDGAGAGAP